MRGTTMKSLWKLVRLVVVGFMIIVGAAGCGGENAEQAPAAQVGGRPDDTGKGGGSTPSRDTRTAPAQAPPLAATPAPK